MSRDHVGQLLRRAQMFAGFRRALLRSPAEAMDGYELTEAEARAVRARDIDALVKLGVDVDLIAWWCIALPEPVARS